jgi:hypothetical protein
MQLEELRMNKRVVEDDPNLANELGVHKNVLEANGITAVMGGNSVLPYLPFEVKVAREQVDRARDLIAEAQIAGPASADEAELETETAEPQGPRKPETA